MTKGRLMQLLQESEAPDSAYIDMTVMMDDSGTRDVPMGDEEPEWLNIPHGPNAADWLTFQCRGL